jgi:hypothetical protein
MASEVSADPSHPEEMDSLILWAAYGNGASRILSVEDPAALEAALIRVWEQQWPRLRRAFSFRTRYRTSAQHADGFDIQIVERLEREQTRVELPDPVPVWVSRRRRDLGHPDSALRSFLRRYGAESENARTTIGPLVTVQELLGVGKRGAVPAYVCEVFPEPEPMRSLKRALLGPQDESANLWDAPEHERLAFALLAEPPTAVNLGDLEVRKRLDALWRERPEDAVQVAEATYRNGTREAEKLVAASTIKHASGAQVASLAEPQPQIAAAAIRKRPELLAAPELWMGAAPARQLVADGFSEVDQKAREEVILTLVRTDAWDAARVVVEQQPDLWWVIFGLAGQRVQAAPDALREWAGRLEQMLVVAGPASIGSMPAKLKGDGVMKLLAVTFPPQAGLWRQARAQRWVEAADSLAEITDERLRLRALVIVISATRLVSTASERRRLWLAGFSALHAGLAGKKVAPSDWEALSTLLPREADEDRCERLRYALAAVIAGDKWTPEDVQVIVAGTHPFEGRMMAALKASRKKKSKGWLRDLLQYLAP